MRSISLISTFILFSLIQLFGQDISFQADPESEFARMRDLAVAGDYGAAKKIGYLLLEENENYFDAALYLARIHGWESSFDSAYLVLDRVIQKAPELYEAYEVCADLAYWQNNKTRLDSCEQLAAEIKYDSAGLFEKYRVALQQPRTLSKSTELFALYSYDHFAVPYVRNWHMITVGGSFHSNMGH